MRVSTSTLFFLLLSAVKGFAPSLKSATRSSAILASPNDNIQNAKSELDRRDVLNKAVAVTAASFLAAVSPMPAFGEGGVIKKVVVAGATGQTGRRVVERLAAQKGLQVVAGVRNVDKASKKLSEASTVLRGAMIQKVPSVDASSVDIRQLDVVMDSDAQLTETLAGAESLVIAAGFVPGENLFKMNEAAHQVDNVGVCRLVDAAKKAGVKKVVLVSSILTNGRAWGQEESAGFKITNAFGNSLDEKLVSEKYLRASGLDYTIVRCGGLKSKPPTGALVIAPEDTVNAGEISRDLVADVTVASLTDAKASKKVLEIIEDEGVPPKVFNGLNM